ncbi:DUF5977 domain-containing protein [Pedobacter suwonensis]|uniref:DUF5977 domain-containing protein n=1 Tax=Pedobacter suwonensis TaxID=332999 RepID=UPI0011A73678|nr:DUF5977 domain-containing protein [Pedobacter suwonensis]
MSDHFCLYGPPFTLNGEEYFSDNNVGFQVAFSSSEDQKLVLAYQWYLNGTLIINEKGASLVGKIYCGNHTVGVRVLSSEGWSGVKSRSFYTCKVPTGLELYGPDTINEGDSATYQVLRRFSDGTVEDLTAQYIFTITGDASFNGNVLTTIKDDSSFGDKVLNILGTTVSGDTIAKDIVVKNTTLFKSAVLVVDLFNDTSLNVIGLIDNPEVTVNHQAVYTGNNFLPASVVAENAYMLASDLMNGATWRFEFNLARLMTEYPGTTDFVFHIKGRSALDQGLNGAFSVKTKKAKMVMTGNASSYVPSVTGGGTVGYNSFSSYSVAGANGSYNEADLFAIIRFNYHVQTDTLTYTIPPRIYLSNPIIEQTQKNNCGAGFIGSNVLYTLPVGAFTSTISQADADAQARSFYDGNKQQYANDHGTCELKPNYHFKSSTNGSYPVTMTTDYSSGDCAMKVAFYATMNNQSVIIDHTDGTTNLMPWGANTRMFKVPATGVYRVKARLVGNIVCNSVGGDADHQQTISFLFTRTGGAETNLIAPGQNSAGDFSAAEFCLPGQYVISKGMTVPIDINFSMDFNMVANEEANFRTRINLFTYFNQQQGAKETNTTNFNFSLLELEIEKL